MSFDSFREHHPNGSRVGDDSLVASGEETETKKYQCVSLVKAYIREEYGLEPGAWGHAIHYWTQTAQPILSKFSQVGGSEAAKGDIVILWGLNGNSYGHIGIGTGNTTDTQLEILEQNGSTGNGTGTGSDAIRTRYVDRSRVAGLLRPITVSPTPSLPYTTEPYTGREVQLAFDTTMWNLSFSNPDDVAHNPVGSNVKGFRFTPQTTLHYKDGNNYYLPNRDQPWGYNAHDCIEYVAPVAAPQVITTQNVPLPPVERYILITRVMHFSSDTDALHHQNYQGDLGEGSYIVIARNGKAYNLTDDNRYDRKWWINTDDNKIPEPAVPTLPVDPPPVHDEPVDFPSPAAEQPKIVSHSLKASGEVVLYQATNSQPIEIRDFQTAQPTITMQPYNYSSQTGKNEPVPLVSTFTIDGEDYGITQKVSKAGWKYGVPMKYLELYELPVPGVAVAKEPPVPHVSSFDINDDGRVDLSDFTDGIAGFIDYGNKIFKTSIAPIIPKTTEAKQRITKVIDGFTAKRKKQ